MSNFRFRTTIDFEVDVPAGLKDREGFEQDIKEFFSDDEIGRYLRFQLEKRIQAWKGYQNAGIKMIHNSHTEDVTGKEPADYG